MMPRLKAGETIQVAVNAPARYHPLARGVLRRFRLVAEQDGAMAGIGAANAVMWTIETSEGSIFEVPETLLARVDEE
jgi:hypothetical protein